MHIQVPWSVYAIFVFYTQQDVNTATHVVNYFNCMHIARYLFDSHPSVCIARRFLDGRPSLRIARRYLDRHPSLHIMTSRKGFWMIRVLARRVTCRFSVSFYHRFHWNRAWPEWVMNVSSVAYKICAAAFSQAGSHRITCVLQRLVVHKKLQSSLANFYLQCPLLTFFRSNCFFNIFVKILRRTRIHVLLWWNLHKSTWLRSFSMYPALRLKVQIFIC